MNKFILIIAASFISIAASAQDFPYGETDNQALDMKKYDKDTSAHAVVLNEYGSSKIAFDNEYSIVMTYTYHTKIKFFDNKEFESEGTFEIPLYNSDGTHYEQAQDIKGVTFFRDENGQVQKTELDRKKVFTVNNTKHWSTLKFAMPALRNGCIVEVSYKVISPYFKFNFHGWDFQDHIPKINSEYEVHIPGFWFYNASLKGPLKLTTNKSSVERGCLTYGTNGYGSGSSADCSDMVYGMNDVPAFIEEDYMTSEKNFRSSISFQLVEETDIVSGVKTKYTKEWKDIDYFLKSYPEFGGQLKRKDLMKERVMPVIVNKTDPLEKAKAIYTYIKNTMKWDGRHDCVSDDGLKQALDKHIGNSGDINLALITALNSAGIPTEAVLLSSREQRAPNKLYPSFTDFNYVVAKANIGDKSYMLDATEPLLPFGMLPMRALNDQGRVFSLDKPSYWIDMTTPQHESVTYNFDLTLQEDGKLKGTISRYSSGYSGYLKRGEIRKFNSTEEYFEHVAETMPKIKILKSNMINLDSLDMAVGETYDVEMNLADNATHDKLRFSPFILDQIKTNPFKLAERNYPVDWGMPKDSRYIITVHVPAQYTIENPPQGIAFAMPDHGGKFLTDFQNDSGTFTYSYVTQFNKSVYTPDEYPYLKELYNKIILNEKSEMVFKKK